MKNKATLLLALALSAGAASGQTISVQPNIMPPYSMYLSEYRNMLVVSVSNLGQDPVTLRLMGSLTGDNGFNGYTKSNYMPASPINLGPYESRVYEANATALDFIDRINFEVHAPTQIRHAVLQTGILPEGNYDFCVWAVDYASGDLMSEMAPAGCTFFPISIVEPPMLTSPWCNDTVATPWPVFTWTPPMGNINLGDVRYDLYILELLPGQNPKAALDLAMDGVSGNPMMRTRLMVPSYPWQPSDPMLEPGKLYAVGVRAYTEGVVQGDFPTGILIENQGRSEVCTFQIGEPPTVIPMSTDEWTIYTQVPPPIGPIADTRIKGRLVYQFKDSGREECAGKGDPFTVNWGSFMDLGSGSWSVGGAASGTSQATTPGTGIFSLGAFGLAGGLGNVGIAGWTGTGSVYVSGAATGAPTGSYDGAPWKDPHPVSIAGGKPLKNMPIRLVERTVLSNVVIRDRDGTVIGTRDRLVLGLDSLPFLVGQLELEDGRDAPWNQGRVVATGTTDDQGRFDLFYHQPSATGHVQQGGVYSVRNPLDFNDPLGHSQHYNGTLGAGSGYKMLMIEVASPYYCSPDLEIYVQPGGTMELPDQACYVRSYDLRGSVAQGKCDFQMGGQGIPIGGVPVALMRPADHRPQGIPKDEGQGLDSTITVLGMGAVPLVSHCATTTADGSALFRNLVFHDPGAPDEYLVQCRTDDERGLYAYHPARQAWPKSPSGGPNVDGSRIYLRNSQFDVKEFSLPVALVPKGPRVMGRVMASTTQPLPGALVTLHLRYDRTTGREQPVVVGCTNNTVSADFDTLKLEHHTDANGFFDFSNLLVKATADGQRFLGPHAWVTVSRAGYKDARRPLPSGSGEKGIPSGGFNNSDPANPKVDLKMGLQWDMNSGILMEPYGLVQGIIQDEDGKPVKCDVQVGAGPWGRSETAIVPVPTSGGGQQGMTPTFYWQALWPTGTGTASPSGSGPLLNWTFSQFQVGERFEVRGPDGQQTVRLIPLSDQYFPAEFSRMVPTATGGASPDLGVFVVKEKRHRLRVELTSPNGPVAGAKVHVGEHERTSNSQGVAYFEFLSAASEFRLRVLPPGELMPVDRIIVNKVSPEPVVLKEYLDQGAKVAGKVVAAPGNSPVAGARVWVEGGFDEYGTRLNQTVTDGNGAFTLHGVPFGPCTIHAAKADGDVSYIGTSQDLSPTMLPVAPQDGPRMTMPTNLTLTLQRADGLDLTTIHGFPVEVTARTTNSDGTTTISGAFVDLPANANFTLADPAQRITFNNLRVKAGTPNAKGIPRAVPVNNLVITDMGQVPLKLHEEFDATLRGLPIFFMPGRVTVTGTPNGGEVRGMVSSELSSFNFSYNFTGVFYLGDGPETHVLPVFRNGAPFPQRTYNLMTLKQQGSALVPSDANFSLRGFPARSDRTRSIVEPGVFRIATVIQIKELPDIAPASLELNVGDIRVTPTTIEGIQGGGEELTFDLNDWKFKATTPWVFDNNLGAIVIPEGELDMQVAKVAMSNVMIRPNSLEMKPGNLGEVRLGGIAPLVPEPNVEWTFGYDPGFLFEGRHGAWRFGTLSSGQATVATINGPKELVPRKIAFSGLSLVSRGGKPLVEARALDYRYHDIMDLVPIGSMQVNDDGVDLLMNCSMAIHGLPQTTGFFSFYEQGGKVVSRLKPLGATITTGRGNVTFKMDDQADAQAIENGRFTCYGRFRIEPEAGAVGAPVYVHGFLDHEAGDTFIDVIKVDSRNRKGTNRQAIAFGGSPDKKMLLNSGRQTMGAVRWNELAFKGNLVNMDGIADNPGNELAFTVKGAVALDEGKIAMDQLSTPFGDMAMSYDFEHARLVGSLDLANNNFGAVHVVNAQLGLLVDKGGFLVSCYDSHVIVPPAPWPLNDHHPAFMIGAHDHIPDTLLGNMMASFRLKKLPPHMGSGRIRGFYLQNKVSLADFSVPSYNLGVMGMKGHASCAVEGRNWVDLSGSIGFGGMAYADAGLSFWLLNPIPKCNSLDLTASASALFEATMQGGTFVVDACGSAGGSASICGKSESFTLTVKARAGSDGRFTLNRTSDPCGQ